MLFKMCVLKNLEIFTVKHLCWSLFLIKLLTKVAGLKVCNFIKKWLQHRCFLVHIAKFLRIAFLQNISSGCFYRCSIKKAVPKIFLNFTRTYRYLSPFKSSCLPRTWNFTKKKDLVQVFCCKFCEISQNNIMQNNGCSWTLRGVAENKCSRN